MIEISSIAVFGGVLAAIVIMIALMCWLASREGRSSALLKEAEKDVKEEIKQREIANDQTQVANNAPTTRNNAFKRLRELRTRTDK